jgi:PAS domain S-box-containing protein
MHFQFVPYCVPLAFSALITSMLAIYGCRKRSMPGAPPFVFCMLAGTLWSACNALEMMGTDLATKLVWSNLQYSINGFALAGFVLLAFQFTGHERWINIRNFILLFGIPAACAVLVWFDVRWGLIRRDFAIVHSYSFPILQKGGYGPVFYADLASTYVAAGVAVLLLIQAIRGKNRSYRRQSAAILIGFSPIGVSNILFLLGLSPIRPIDITPTLFGLEGIVIARGIFKHRLFDLSPIARELVFENMSCGVAVTDLQNRILDVNGAFEKRIVLSEADSIGKRIDEVAAFLFPSEAEAGTDRDSRVSLPSEDSAPVMWQARRDGGGETGEAFFEVSASPLRNSYGEWIGWVYMVSDITEINHAREKIHLQQRALAIAEEQHRVARDLHDNIGQVLSFSSIQMQTIQRELSRGNTELAVTYIKKAQTTLEKAHDDIREYVFNLRSPEMQRTAFQPLLEELVRGLLQGSNIVFQLDLDPSITRQLEYTERKNHLLSLSKEAINNIIKHAGATRIVIGTRRTADGFEYYIEDDGKGFSPAFVQPQKTSGLRIMEERSMLTGGRLRVFSSPHKGTCITVQYPAEDEDKP